MIARLSLLLSRPFDSGLQEEGVRLRQEVEFLTRPTDFLSLTSMIFELSRNNRAYETSCPTFDSCRQRMVKELAEGSRRKADKLCALLVVSAISCGEDISAPFATSIRVENVCEDGCRKTLRGSEQAR